MPIRICIPRLVRMMAIQQMAPRRMDFPLDLTIATRFGFETDGTHGHDNEEFGELFEWGKETTGHTKRGQEGS